MVRSAGRRRRVDALAERDEGDAAAGSPRQQVQGWSPRLRPAHALVHELEARRPAVRGDVAAEYRARLSFRPPRRCRAAGRRCGQCDAFDFSESATLAGSCRSRPASSPSPARCCDGSQRNDEHRLSGRARVRNGGVPIPVTSCSSFWAATLVSTRFARRLDYGAAGTILASDKPP